MLLISHKKEKIISIAFDVFEVNTFESNVFYED